MNIHIQRGARFAFYSLKWNLLLYHHMELFLMDSPDAFIISFILLYIHGEGAEMFDALLTKSKTLKRARKS